MLRIEYASFAEDEAGRIGFLADGTTPLLVHQDGKIIPFVFPKDTIVLDKLEPSTLVVYGVAPDKIFTPYKQKGIEVLQFDSDFMRSRKAVSA